MIIKIDLTQKIVYIDGPMNLAEFLDTMFLLTDQEDDEEEWTVMPDMVFHFSQS